MSPATRPEIEGRFREEGLSPTGWGNGPGDTYGWHSHANHKVLYCVSGSIVFHTRDGDVELQAGDRLDLPPGTEHAATVGPAGCQCLEAYRTAAAR
ncbi:MAG TPA: cupin domain-containing protein [Acidimicrobiales bacterium]|nr:cupin domain-containing protein [Acidimicrobiales bacterium]